MLVCTFGDLLLDVVVLLERPFARGDDAPARTLTAPGGQAANVAAWAAALGARARFVGKRGTDEAGELAAAGLAARGVEVAGPVAQGATGVVVSLVEPDGERTMASDRGVSPSFAPDELEPRWVERCDWLFLSGYSLLRAPVDGTAARAAALARADGARVAVDLSSWSLIRAAGAARQRERLAAVAPDVVFASAAELAELDGWQPPADVVLKRAADGFSAGGASYPARATAVVDTTGAGDALAAGYLVGGAELAADAAARCVERRGAMP